MQPNVRTARPEDAGGMLQVLNPIIIAGCYTALDQPFSLEEERAFIVAFPARGVLHVTEEGDGTIVGFQTVEPFATYTRAFDHVGIIGTYVSLSHRGQGIGSRLMQATVEAAIGKGYEKLFAYVRADNAAALEFYRSRGFETIGKARRHARIRGSYIDEWMIERLLAM